jgi:hypothetical protein
VDSRADPLLIYQGVTLEVDRVTKFDGIIVILQGLPDGDQLGKLLFVDRCGRTEL